MKNYLFIFSKFLNVNFTNLLMLANVKLITNIGKNIYLKINFY